MIRVILPGPLQILARTEAEVRLRVAPPVTPRAIVQALEATYPDLRGTVFDPATQKRRPLLRFFVCGEDLSHESPDAPLPEAIVSGKEPFIIVGAIAGG